MADTFCITLNHCRSDGDRATVALAMASAALESGKDTLVFLSTDGVWAAKRGEAAKIHEGGPFPPLKDLIEAFLEGGGKMVACEPCCQKRGIEKDDLMDGVDMAGGGLLVEWLAKGSPCVAY